MSEYSGLYNGKNVHELYDRDGLYLGLCDQLCDKPVYFCNSHKVFLSEDDVARKGCLCKLCGTEVFGAKCSELMTIDEYEDMRDAAYEVNHRSKKAAKASMVYKNTYPYPKNNYSGLVKKLLEEQKNAKD